MSAAADLRGSALACIAGYVSIIPIDYRSKRPAMWLLPRGDDGAPTWKPYQLAVPTEHEVHTWIDGGALAFAVVAGDVSGGPDRGGLLVLDFDVERFYTAWRERIGDLADGLVVQRTGGGGYQVLMRCPDPAGNAKLAWVADEAEASGRTIAIETRGEGGYAVVAPSLHPSGNRYQILEGELSAIPTVSRERADALLAVAAALDEAPLTRQQRERAEQEAIAQSQRRHGGRNGETSVIDAFNTANAITEVLERHGYTKGPRGRYVRPGGSSESVSVRDGRSCHWSSNDSLNDGNGPGGCGCHDAFDVFVHLDHQGDVHTAVRVAAQELGLSSSDGSTSTLASPPTYSPWPDPLPLPQGLPPVLPFDLNLVPQALRPWIEDVSDRMQCPPDYCAATAMVMAGALIGRRVAIRPKRQDDWQVVANLYGAMIGRPSLLKSPAMKEM